MQAVGGLALDLIEQGCVNDQCDHDTCTGVYVGM